MVRQLEIFGGYSNQVVGSQFAWSNWYAIHITGSEDESSMVIANNIFEFPTNYTPDGSIYNICVEHGSHVITGNSFFDSQDNNPSHLVYGGDIYLGVNALAISGRNLHCAQMGTDPSNYRYVVRVNDPTYEACEVTLGYKQGQP